MIADNRINVGNFPHLVENIQAGIASEDIQSQFRWLGGIGGGVEVKVQSY